MRYGTAIFLTDQTPQPADVGRLVEERGLDSIWLPEHTHMPLDHTPHPSGRLGRPYKRSLDPFVALAAIASATERIRLGFGISLITQRDPITTAKAVATLDLVSEGRVDYGVGAGWNQPELENHGAPFDRRFKVMRERVEAMRALWEHEEAEYHGEFVDFDPTWSWPKPVQERLPVYVGGHNENTLKRIVRYGDGWCVMFEHELAPMIARLHELAEAAGRDRPQVVYFGVGADPAMLERLEAAGVDEALMMLPTRDMATIEATLDEAQGAIGTFTGAA